LRAEERDRVLLCGSASADVIEVTRIWNVRLTERIKTQTLLSRRRDRGVSIQSRSGKAPQ
jgi:hypothetical protein